jgi:tRNA threonylcarbamoyladenosine biosynthesis protein TsaB
MPDVIVLALDTCDKRGDVTLLKDEAVAGHIRHDDEQDYSSWLLPAVGEILDKASVAMKDLDGFGVAAGPGSFTGVRVGLTTAKAWVEVYAKPVVAVSRLEALAQQAAAGGDFVGCWMDARRSQVFGAIYKRAPSGLELVGDEMVIAADRFLELSLEAAGSSRIAWATTDAECLANLDGWKKRAALHEPLNVSDGYLGPAIARMASKGLAAGRTIDVLKLDANYVRRSDAEIFWKDAAKSAALSK